MSVRFCVLGSGSKGNAALLQTPHLQVLIDAGFAPDELAARLAGTGAGWKSLDAVLLTHTHGDHIKRRCFGLLAEHGVQFFCHKRHARFFEGSRYFSKLKDKGLVAVFDASPFEVAPKPPLSIAPDRKPHTGFRAADCSLGDKALLRVQPIQLPHDSPPTLGFRLEVRCSGMGFQPMKEHGQAARATERWVRLAYLADLGECSDEVARAAAGVDLLALEFNHDEEMELASGRHPLLIERVLSSEGHLSNAQAAEAFRRVVELGANGGPTVLVQLHLSQECNDPTLAYQAARQAILASGVQTQVFSTRQDQRGTVHVL